MIFSIGEALIDLFPNNTNSPIKKVGGTNANVSACVALLGGKASLITKLREDENGKLIYDTLQKIGVDTSKIFFTSEHPTGIINVSPTIDGSELCSLRKNSADRFLSENEIDCNWFSSGDILHFCSSGLVESKTKYAHKKAINAVINQGGKVSFDINLRPKQWQSKEEYQKEILDILNKVNYLKISEEEIERLFENNYNEFSPKDFFKKYPNMEYLFITFADKGTAFYHKHCYEIFIPYFNTNIVDLTGAGDCFIASILYLLDKNSQPTKEEMEKILIFSSAAASLTIQKIGAISSLPSEKEITNFIKTQKKSQ